MTKKKKKKRAILLSIHYITVYIIISYNYLLIISLPLEYELHEGMIFISLTNVSHMPIRVLGKEVAHN